MDLHKEKNFSSKNYSLGLYKTGYITVYLYTLY